MNVLYGIHQPDSGAIIINGERKIINTPAVAISLGIGMVHQHFMLVPPLTVTENIILGREPTRMVQVLDMKRAEQHVEQLSAAYHLEIDPSEKVENLSIGLQQRVEILKILYRNADILILDEPTAVLTPQETEELFAILRKMKEQEKTVILITHKLDEVMAISDRVTVMRRGKVVQSVETQATNQSELARLMVGDEFHNIDFLSKKRTARTSPSDDHSIITETKAIEPVLAIEGLSAFNDKRLVALRNITLPVYGREIVGIAAVEGNGQSELVQVLAGLREPSCGVVKIDGVDIFRHKIRIAHIPEDRHKHGLVLEFTLAENFLLGRQNEEEFSSPFVLHRKAVEDFTARMIVQFDIRATQKAQTARQLSGGNQQKVVIAREISKNAPVIVVSQPTRGLDIYATQFVYRTLFAERDKGKAILLVSSDLTELLTLSDRIAVMYGGEIVAVLNAGNTSERELGLYMTGVRRRAG